LEFDAYDSVDEVIENTLKKYRDEASEYLFETQSKLLIKESFSSNNESLHIVTKLLLERIIELSLPSFLQSLISSDEVDRLRSEIETTDITHNRRWFKYGQDFYKHQRACPVPLTFDEKSFSDFILGTLHTALVRNWSFNYFDFPYDRVTNIVFVSRFINRGDREHTEIVTGPNNVRYPRHEFHTRLICLEHDFYDFRIPSTERVYYVFHAHHPESKDARFSLYKTSKEDFDILKSLSLDDHFKIIYQ
jgi:hypothetical protein